MLRVFTITRENNIDHDVATVIDDRDLSVDETALLSVCETIWPGTLDEDFGYFALPVDTTSMFITTSISNLEENCWEWKVSVVAETEDYRIESVITTGRAVTKELAQDEMMKEYVKSVNKLKED